jgi:4-hydroxybenzoate polyprenyltransferase
MNWLHTIRWKNLIIIWISILVVIIPCFDHILSYHLLGEFIRWCLICSSIAAIGNITNDWMDVKQDRENKKANIFIKPGKNKIGIMFILFFLSVAAVSILLSNNQRSFLMLSASSLLLLLLYNSILKKIALIGNLIIAILTALIFFGIDIIVLNRVIYFEIGLENKQIEMLAMFAFLTTFIREILKDAEDRKGDLFAGFSTIAKFLKDRWIAILVIIINLSGCIAIYFLMEWRQANFTMALLLYSSWVLLVSLSASVFMLIPHPSRYVRATRIVKAGMLGCLAIYLILSF